jgi:transcription elongation factor SPT5
MVLIITQVIRFADFTMQRGLEEDAIWYILRYMEGLVDENSPKVQSAFARTIVPGYIFVEALSIADVRHACEGFIGYQGRYKKICLIVDNVASLLEYQHPDLKLRANSWVRVKRGMYTGDLAFLCRVDVADLEDEQFQRTQGTAYLRVIPRIPFQAKVSLKRKCRGVRPSQQFFDPFCWPKEASKLPQKPETSDPDGWIFRRGVFNSGLLDLEVPLNPLNLGNATPSRSELQLWGTCRDSDVQYFALKSLKALDEEFWVDDRVKVISGEQLGGMGVVSKVSEESVSIFLWMDILGDNGQQGPSSIEVQFMPASIRKVFEVGDYVEAVIDDNRPRRGFVIAIHQTEGEQDMVAISERGCQEVSVPTCTVISDLT